MLSRTVSKENKANFSSFGKNRKLGYILTGGLACVLLAWMVVVPLLMVLRNSFIDNETGVLTGANWVAVFTGENLRAIGNSLLLSFCVTLLSSVLALPLSYFLSKTRLRKAWWLGILMMIPFMIPPYINSLAWMLFMQREGIVWRLIPGLRPLCEHFYSFFGMVWIMSMHTFPFLTTMLNTALDSFPSNIEDALNVYSRNKGKSLLHVYVPILLPNYLIGAFLVFVKAMSEYGTPATFGLQINYTVFTTLITNYMQVSPINFSMASSLASVMIFICMLLWMAETYIVRKKSYPLMPGQKVKINTSKVTFVFGIVFCVLLHFFSAFIPLSTLFITSFKQISFFPIWKEGNFTFANYVTSFVEDQGFGTGFKALGNTFLISFISSLIVLILGLAFGIYCRRYRTKVLGKGVEFLATLPQMLPNIVTGIGLIFLYNGISKAIPVYRTPLMMVIGYSVILLPGMFSYIKNALTQMPESILEAGEVFSRNRLSTDFFIVLPTAFKGSVYGFLMTMIVAFRELITAKLLQAPGFYTLSLYIDFQYQQGSMMAAMALSVVSVGITLLILLPLEFVMKERKKEA